MLLNSEKTLKRRLLLPPSNMCQTLELIPKMQSCRSRFNLAVRFPTFREIIRKESIHRGDILKKIRKSINIVAARIQVVEIHRSSILSLKPLKFDRRYIILEQKIKEKILYIHLYNDNRLTFASQRRKQLFANRRNETNNISS